MYPWVYCTVLPTVLGLHGDSTVSIKLKHGHIITSVGLVCPSCQLNSLTAVEVIRLHNDCTCTKEHADDDRLDGQRSS